MSTKKSKIHWNLKKLFYSSPSDPRLMRDVAKIKRALEAFAKKYGRDKRYLSDEKALKRALDEYSALQEATDPKPVYYLFYRLSLNSADAAAEALMNRLQTELTEHENKILFFTLELGKIAPAVQKKFLKSAVLAPYRYFLSRIFETAKHRLSEPEERILNLKELPSRGLWMQGAQKLENKQTLAWKGKDVPLSAAPNMLMALPTRERRELGRALYGRLRAISDFAESELNAVVIDKKINDTLRGFKEPYASRLLGDQTDEKTVLGLADVVTKHFKISHEYHSLKKKLLRLPHLENADRLAQIGTIKKSFSFNDAVEIIRAAFYGVGERYGGIFDMLLAEGRIDALPRKGKRAGAFCSHGVMSPTMLLLNHTNTFYDVTVMAHETGHAVHSELSRSQPPLYRDYSTAVAETASTFFESVVFDALYAEFSEREKIIALEASLMSSVSTIFRQIAFFNFERELHGAIREKGAVSKEEIAAMLNRHNAAYLGPAVRLTEDDGYFFVKLSHIRTFFYVYTYAFGELVSRGLYEKYKMDRTYIKEIEKFLSAGGSKRPAKIFKDIGIDISKPKFFETGIKSIEDEIQLLKRLTKK